MYYFPKSFSGRLNDIAPSRRNELEITSLIETYLQQKNLDVNYLSRGTAWFDAGTPERLFMAADYVRILQERSGEIVGSPEEVALRNGLVSQHFFDSVVDHMPQSRSYFARFIGRGPVKFPLVRPDIPTIWEWVALTE